MKRRIFYGIILLAAVVGVLWLDGWMETESVWTLRVAPGGAARTVTGIPVAAVLAVLVLLAFREIEIIASSGGVGLLPISGIFGALGLTAIPAISQFTRLPYSGPAMLVVLGILCLAVFMEQMARHGPENGVRRVSQTVLAVVYLGVGAGLAVQIRMDFGMPAMAFALLAVKFTDIGAYFAGTLAGRHAMSPRVSPNKTWEGLAGGAALAVGVSMLAAWLLARLPGGEALANVRLWQAAVFGAAMALAGQTADLAESVLKRSAEVKDSASLVPEFGGVLDMLDSVLLSAPVAYIMLGWMTG